ncbi:MAG: hypothetical protein ATN32_04250 [Candidatus Epulonipiscium fishelsonii]|nr:MAG: hypothetical protein ATN32_04250 [Epulopiscium sp. AS2M-Bin002]
MNIGNISSLYNYNASKTKPKDSQSHNLTFEEPEYSEKSNRHQQFSVIPDDPKVYKEMLEGKIKECIDKMDLEGAIKYQKELQALEAMMSGKNEVVKKHFDKLTANQSKFQPETNQKL